VETKAEKLTKLAYPDHTVYNCAADIGLGNKFTVLVMGKDCYHKINYSK